MSDGIDLSDVYEIEVRIDGSAAVAQARTIDLAIERALPEVYQTTVEVAGLEEMRKHAADIAAADRALLEFADAAQRSTTVSTAAAQSARVMGTTFQFIASQVRNAATSFSASGQGLQNLGYLLDDLQYIGEQGLRPVINNLMQINPILGMVALGADQLWRHWDKVMALMGEGVPPPALSGLEGLEAGLKKAQDRMEELQKQTRLTFWELKEYRSLREKIEAGEKAVADRKAVDAATGQLSDEEKARGSGFGKAVAESGGKMARNDLADRLAEGKNGAGLVFNEAKGAWTTPAQASEDLFAAALKGDKMARDAIARAMGGTAFGENIGKFSPEAAAAEKDDKAEDAAQSHLDAQMRAADDARARSDEAARAKEEAEEKAAQDLLERSERENAGRRSDWEAGGRDEKAAAKDRADRVDAIRDGHAGIDEAIKGQLKAMIGSGMTPIQAQSATVGQLRDRFGAENAIGLVSGQLGGAQSELMADWVKGPGRRNSQVIGAAGLADSIQSAVGGDDTQKQQLDQLRRQTAFLQMIANKSASAPVFGANGQLGG